MALIIEDGTGKTDAESYISLADARAFLQKRGFDLNATDATAEQHLVRAVDALESYRDQFKGCKASEAQALQWPRYGVWIDGYSVDNDEIPEALKQAQIWGAYEIDQGGDLQENSTGQAVAKERVEGAVEVAYFDTGQGAELTRFAKMNDALSPLLSGSSGRVRGARG